MGICCSKYRHTNALTDRSQAGSVGRGSSLVRSTSTAASKGILIVGHSNEKGLQLASDFFLDWRTVGKRLRPLEPQFIVLAACEAGKSKAVRQLFEPLKTLRDAYASPVKLYAPQAAALAVLNRIAGKRSSTSRDRSKSASRRSCFCFRGSAARISGP